MGENSTIKAYATCWRNASETRLVDKHFVITPVSARFRP